MEIDDLPHLADRLNHNTFGPGSVQAVSEGVGLGQVIRIKFDNHGVKDLVWTFAHPKMQRLPIAELVEDRFKKYIRQ
jgi:hypothetical protein